MYKPGLTSVKRDKGKAVVLFCPFLLWPLSQKQIYNLQPEDRKS